MGIGNLESVLRAYADPGGEQPIGELVADQGLSYARVYFDSSPYAHRDAYELLTGFGDESAEYLWKVRASEQRPAPLPRRSRAARRDRRAGDREGDLGGGLPSRGRDRGLRRSRCDRGRARRRRAGASSRSTPGSAGSPTSSSASSRGELDQDAGALPRAAPRGAGDAQLPGRPRSCYESNEPAPLLVTQRGPRPRLPGAADRGQPRGDERVLAAHDRVGVRHPPRIRLPAPGGGVPAQRSTGSARWR